MKLFAIAPVLALALGALTDDEGKREIICETSDASPYLHHVDWLIENLQSDPKQHNLCIKGVKEGHCGDTRKKWSGDGGGAVFSLCRTEEDDNKLLCITEGSGSTPCPRQGESQYCGGYAPLWIAVFLMDIRDYCKGEERVGGRMLFHDGGELRLYTMPGF